MENEFDQVMVLNDLVKMNNDRIKGYRTAADNFKGRDNELHTVFNRFAMESQANKDELTEQIRRIGGVTEEGTTPSGDIYNTWMDGKAEFGAKDSKGALENCGCCEDAAKKAYKDALNSNRLDPQAHAVVINQQNKQFATHDQLKGLTDNPQD